MKRSIGIDIGSTTLKVIVLNESDEILYQCYERHKSQVRTLCLSKLQELKPLLDGHEVYLCFSGSAAMGIAEDTKLTFVQEVFASALAISRNHPDTDAAIELGGEDAKIIFFQGGLEERMNSTCAGGTGAFIDQMASLLNLSLEEMDTLSLSHTQIYPIASRCGVFAKSDIQPLMNQGVDKANLAASIFQAVVDQCIAGLAQGRKLEGTILFLGGPLSFLKGLQKRFQETLKLDDAHAVFPALGPYFVAYGSALFASTNAQALTYSRLMNILSTLSYTQQFHSALPPLFQTEEDYSAFCQRHSQSSAQYCDIHTYCGKAWLGIDCGSTTTKLVLINDQNQILYQSYASNQGNPVDVVKCELRRIYELCAQRIQIVHSAVTGYGEELIKAAFHIDIGLVETLAHYEAARHFNPDVDFILDIGGQDMKCFRIRNQAIDEIILNEACSSGCGSFIETFAHSLGYDAQSFAQLGLKSRHPVDLGTRCTVFMNSSVKQAQKNGASIEDISAGLCLSVVRNALYKVIRARSKDEIGKEIVVQGGTFQNDAILRCFEMELGRNVIRPSIAHLMGAFGAALTARKTNTKASSMLSYDAVSHFQHTAKAVRCQGCVNHCALTINTFAEQGRYIAGNKCERPLIGRVSREQLPNLYDYKYHKLRNLKAEIADPKGKVGIPLVLGFYDNLPFYHAFFSALGYEVVLSEESSQALYTKGASSISDDTVCFPAKLSHGHLASLMEQDVDFIFYPCMSYNFDEQISDNYYNCPVVAYYPESLAANMDFNKMFLYPYLYVKDQKVFAEKMYESLKLHNLPVTQKEVQEASIKAYHAYHAFRSDIKAQGAKAIAFAKEHHRRCVILAGRPYHVDPLIHHGIDKLLNSLGFAVLSEDSLPIDQPGTVNVLNQWTYHARLYQAALFASQHANIELIQLVSFGCGLDAVTADEVRALLSENHKLYTQIKIDEIDNLGAVRIRCRSLLAAIEERENVLCA